MKITIEPSHDQSSDAQPYSTVTIELPHDDVAMSEMMEQVVRALQAWGYQNETISTYLDDGFAHELGLSSSEDKDYVEHIKLHDDPIDEEKRKWTDDALKKWLDSNDTTSERGGV